MYRDTAQVISHYNVQIPSELWTSGYMAVLTGPGVALLLILLDQYGPGKITEPRPVWFSPRVLKERYGLSDETRIKGMNDLRQLGFLTIKRQPINPQDFDIQRIRNTYTLDLSALDRPAHRIDDPHGQW